MRPNTNRTRTGFGLATLLAALALSTAPAAQAQAQGSTPEAPSPSEVTPATEAPGGDAGTAQALADDDAPTDADADAAAGENEVAAETVEGAAPGDGAAAGLAEQECSAILAMVEERYSMRRSEATAALEGIADEAPLVLRMKGGDIVDLRPQDVEAGPTENWFGDPPRRQQVDDAITSLRGFNESGDQGACAEAGQAITALIDRWDGGEMGEDATASATPVAADPVAPEPVVPATDGTGSGDDEGAPAADAPAGEGDAMQVEDAPTEQGALAMPVEGTDAQPQAEAPAAEESVTFEDVPLESMTESADGVPDAEGSDAPRMVETPGEIIIQRPDGSVVDPSRPEISRSVIRIEPAAPAE